MVYIKIHNIIIYIITCILMHSFCVVKFVQTPRRPNFAKAAHTT